MKSYIPFTCLLLLATFIFTEIHAGKPGAKASVYPAGLQCEYLLDPMGIDVREPRLSWRLEATDPTRRGQTQTAYRIRVAGSESELVAGKNLLWDSGNIRSGESVNIEYAGQPLVAGQEYYWAVQAADESGRWSVWSAPARWTTGIYPEDWKAGWIGAHTAALKDKNGETASRHPDPWLRRTFELSAKPRRAVIYVASIGYHELYVNGSKVGDDVLAPSVTDHSKRARYVTYDIAPFLENGKNVIVLWLGTAWSVFPAYQTDDKPAAPIVSAQADLCFTDGSVQTLLTDGTWKSYPSPNTLIGHWDAHQFGGEVYDGPAEIDGWNEALLDDSGWYPVSVFNPDIIVSAEKTYANRLVTEIKPVAIEEVEPGLFRIDMGVNYAGWFEMEVAGSEGDQVGFQFSERENDSASYGLHSLYRIGPSGKGVFRNRFNYMSGRWIRITGSAEKPHLDQIRGWMIRPDYARTGGFECDQPLMNEIYRTTLWTLENLSLGNYVVDCPQRERRGYGGDALATTRTQMATYDAAAFYAKWMEDWRDVQGPDGNVPYTAPTYVGGGGPSWSGYCITLPNEMYRQYGDKRLLEESFPTIERWLAFVETKTENDMLVRWGGKWSFLGDWLWPDAGPERSRMEQQGLALGDTRETLFFNNAHWVLSLEKAARIADIIGKPEPAEAYRSRAQRAREAIHRTFFNPADSSYVNGYQAYLAIALAADIPPPELRPSVWRRLEQEILVHKEGHIWAGITGGAYLLNTLLDHNRSDLIYSMASRETFPGWGDMLQKGTTTFFEDWPARGSALHSSYLYIGAWFTECLGGIRRPEAGYKHFTIEPWIDQTQGPQRVNSHYDSLYGRIESNWSKTDGMLRHEIVMPPNTTAVLCLHGIDAGSLRENGQRPGRIAGAGPVTEENGIVRIPLTAGRYAFTAQMKGYEHTERK